MLSTETKIRSLRQSASCRLKYITTADGVAVASSQWSMSFKIEILRERARICLAFTGVHRFVVTITTILVIIIIMTIEFIASAALFYDCVLVSVITYSLVA